MVVKPVRAWISSTKSCTSLTSTALETLSVTSQSRIGGRSPSANVPTVRRKKSACWMPLSAGRKKWYAPRTMPAALIPAQFVWNNGSLNVTPSVALVMPNACPEAATLFQSMAPSQCEMSTPLTVGPVAQTVAALDGIGPRSTPGCRLSASQAQRAASRRAAERIDELYTAGRQRGIRRLDDALAAVFSCFGEARHLHRLAAR